jgi:UDP-2,3-diacylglucosamine hydrolase
VPETLFISDLHLDRDRPEIRTLFHDFLETRASQADALYILGDLFEFWIGSDDPDQAHADTLAALKKLADSGVPVYFIPGNRDFLVDEAFEQLSGCQVLSDHQVIDLYGRPVLIMHGDTLCTDDVEYQKMRLMFRNSDWQAGFLAQPYDERLQQVLALRKQSAEAMQAKDEYIMDVNQDAVIKALQEHRVNALIHGHTHRPAVHEFTLGEDSATRYVLGDWYEQGSLLSCSPNDCVLTELQAD